MLESVFLVKKSKLRVSFENSWRWLLQGGHVCLGFLKLLDFLKGKKNSQKPHKFITVNFYAFSLWELFGLRK